MLEKMGKSFVLALQSKLEEDGRYEYMICKAHCASAYPFGPLDVPLDPL